MSEGVFDKTIINAAITGKDRDIFEIIAPEMFDNKILGKIFNFAYKIYKAGYLPSYDNILHYIDLAEKAKEKEVEGLREELKILCGGVYVYDKKMLDVFVKQYQTRAVKSMSPRLAAVGDKYSIETARKEVGELYEVLKYGHRLQSNETFETLHAEAMRKIEAKESDVTLRMMITNPWMVTTWGKWLYNRLYIIGGLPSMGKNIVADNLALHLSDTNPGVYFAFDNSATETMAGLMAIGTRIDYSKILDNNLYPDQLERCKKFKPKNEITIIDRPLSASEIRMIVEREKVKHEKQKKRLGWVMIDYFQNIKITNNSNPVREYEEAVKEIKFITKDLGIAVILLSQSNDKERKWQVGKKSEDEDPYLDFHLTDLKWCAGLGQEAYHVVGMCGKRKENERVIKTVKNKRGKLGKTTVGIVFEYAEVREIKKYGSE